MKINQLWLLTSILLMTSCATNNSTTSTQTDKSIKNIKQERSEKNGSTFVILNNIPYSDANVIPAKVKSECAKIGKQFSNSIVKYANKNGIKVIQTEDLLSVNKNIVVINIHNVYSAGNAFIGHRKSVTAEAKLLSNGKEVASQAFTRNSTGGFMGAFKGSCSILAHTVNTLGNDIAKWLKRL